VFNAEYVQFVNHMENVKSAYKYFNKSYDFFCQVTTYNRR